MSLQTLKSEKDLEQALEKGVTLVAFNAPWCAPCQSQEPILIHLANQAGQQTQFIKMDIESIPQFAKLHGIQALPTIIIFKNNKEIQRFTGVHEESVLQGALENVSGHRLDEPAQNTSIEGKEQVMNEDKRQDATTETHKPARPLKFFKDSNGDGWLCDTNIDPKGDLRAQGCWRCDEMAFPAGGR